MAEEKGSRSRPKLGEPIDTVVDAGEAVVKGARRAADGTPNQTVTMTMLITLTALVAVLGHNLWRDSDERKTRDRINEERSQSQIREAHTQAELAHIRCTAESDKVRKDSAENMRAIVATFLSEGEKNRKFQAEENAKFRTEVVTAIRAGKSP